MVRTKVAAAMAGAALVVALHGGTAGAEGDSRDAGGERPNAHGSILCTQDGGTMWLDTDGNGIMDESHDFPCFGRVGVLRF